MPVTDPVRRKVISQRYYQKHKKQIQQKRQDPAFKEKHRQFVRRHSLSTRYGITPEDYERMLKQQHGGCAMCDTTVPGTGKQFFDVDHCHRTGIVRGLLCGRCNKYLGWLEKNADLREVAEAYLGQFDPK